MIVYVLYRDDDVLGVGTAEELARLMGVRPETIRFYASNCSKQRNKKLVAERVYVRDDEFR